MIIGMNKIFSKNKEITKVYSYNQLVYEASNLGLFYNYGSTGTLSLNDNFKIALNNNTDYIVNEEVVWAYGTQLPNPGPQAVSYFGLFEGTTVNSLDLSLWSTDTVTNFGSMFKNCVNLTTVNLSNFNTVKVDSMYAMFQSCSSLISLDLNHFDTSLVDNFVYMFQGCSSLNSLNVSNFNFLSEGINLFGMFDGCSLLQTLDLTNWQTTNIRNMGRLFRGCTSLNSILSTGFNIPKVTDMYEMFAQCRSLSSLNFKISETTSVTNMSGMFRNCEKITTIDLSEFNTSLVTEMEYMFYNCALLESINLSTFNTALVTDMSRMFESCRILTNIDTSSFITTSLVDISNMFRGCDDLLSIDLSSWDTTTITTLDGAFEYCYSVDTAYAKTQVDAEKLNTSTNKPENVNFILNPLVYLANFYIIENESISLTSAFKEAINNDTDLIIDGQTLWTSRSPIPSPQLLEGHYLSGLFEDMTMEYIDISQIKTYNSLASIPSMFENCTQLKTIKGLPEFFNNIDLIFFPLNLFYNCSSLLEIDLSTWDTLDVPDNDFNNMFFGCTSVVAAYARTQVDADILNASEGKSANVNFVLKPIDLYCYDYESAGNGILGLQAEFKNALELNTNYQIGNRTIWSAGDPLPSFNTTKISGLIGVFFSMPIERLDLSLWDVSNVDSFQNVCIFCENLQEVNTSTWTFKEGAYLSNVFNACPNLKSIDFSNDTVPLTIGNPLVNNCEGLIDAYLTFDNKFMIKNNVQEYIGADVNALAPRTRPIYFYDESVDSIKYALGGTYNIKDGYAINVIQSIYGSGEDEFYHGFIVNSTTTASVAFFNIYINKDTIGYSMPSWEPLSDYVKDSSLIRFDMLVEE